MKARHARKIRYGIVSAKHDLVHWSRVMTLEVSISLHDPLVRRAYMRTRRTIADRGLASIEAQLEEYRREAGERGIIL